MGLLEKIKAHELTRTDRIVNAQGETLVSFSLNAQAEYLGDIEIHRDDLQDMLFDLVSNKDIEFLFENTIEYLEQTEEKVKVTLKNGETKEVDFVFGADGTHSRVRKLVFGPEDQFSKFFGAYFAFANADNIRSGEDQDSVTLYRELNQTAMAFQFNGNVYAGLIFRYTAQNYHYKDRTQHEAILLENFQDNKNWKIPEILSTLLNADDLYFDEVCQIHMPAWTNARVALVGDAAHATSFFTGMGTSLALQGASLLAKELHENKDYKTAFNNYYNIFKPFTQEVQARITRGLNAQLPTSEAALQQSIDRFKNKESEQ